MWFLISVIFFLLGFTVHKLKWYFLISGYNTMSKEKKANVNVKALGRLMGMYSYFIATLLFIMGILSILEVEVSLVPLFVLFGVATVFLLIKSQKYDGNLFDAQGKLRKGVWKQLILPGSILGVVLIGVVVLFYYFSQPINIMIKDKELEISGMYGDVYKWDSISNVELIEELPEIKYRSNGAAIGSHLIGYFQTKELGNIKLFVDTDYPPFILFESEGKVIIFNLENAERTTEIYEEMTGK